MTIRLEPDDAAKLRAICTDRGISQADWLSEKINFDPYEAIDDAAQLLAEIMRDDVNPQDEAEKWIRSYAPHHLFPETVSEFWMRDLCGCGKDKPATWVTCAACDRRIYD